MKVDIYSDFVCPFCYIGKTKFESALSQFEHRNDVQIVYKSFELSPHTSGNELTQVSLAKKYGMSVDQAQEMTKNVASQASEVGLTFRFDEMRDANTFDAHRLLMLAQQKGLASKYVTTVFSAYFSDNENIADHQKLTELAVKAGLNEQDVAAVLSSDQYGDLVRKDEQQASDLGVSGVPFFVINDKYAISGAQPQNVFLNALQQIWEETKPQLVSFGDDSTGQCGPDGCKI